MMHYYVSVQSATLPSGKAEFEKLLRESQKEVLRLQRQLSVTSSRQHYDHSPDHGGPEKCVGTDEEQREEKVKSSPSFENTVIL